MTTTNKQKKLLITSTEVSLLLMAVNNYQLDVSNRIKANECLTSKNDDLNALWLKIYDLE